MIPQMGRRLWVAGWSRRRWFAVLLTAVTLQEVFAQGTHVESGRGKSVVEMEAIRQLREDVDLWPGIRRPRNEAERRVNATLTRLNTELAKRVRDCLSGEFAWSKETFTGGEYTRKVAVTMRGPRFLSMVASDGFYCGGAHPDDDLTVLVFDLDTGQEVDWISLVDKGTGASQAKNVLGDEGGTRPLVLPKLQAMYAAGEEEYCREAFQDERSFFLWPDAESGTLVAEVAGLSHADIPCKIESKLTLQQARGLGFAEPLLQAIEEAHRLASEKAKATPARKQSAPAGPSRPD